MKRRVGLGVNMRLVAQLRDIYGGEGPYIFLASLVANTLSLALPLIFIQIYDRVIPAQNYATLGVLAAGLVVAAIAELFVRTARARMMSVVGTRYEFNTMNAAFRNYLSADLRTVSAEPTGKHIDRITAIDKIREYRSGDSATAFLDLPFAIIFLGVVAWIAPLIAGALIALIVVAAATSWLVSRHARILDERHAELEGRRHSFLIEVLGGMDSIKSLGIGPFMVRRYERMKGTSANYSRDAISISHFAQGIVGVFSQTAPIVAGCAGAVLFVNGQLTVGALAAVTLMAGRIVSPVLRLESLLVGSQNTKRYEDDVNAIMSLPQHHSGTATIDRIDEIALEDIEYRVDGGSNPVLCNASLSFRRGEIIGICGAPGAGKSVLLSMFAGKLAPTAGRILINRKDYGEIDYWSLRKQIAYLPQKHTLLDGTIIENLTRFDKARYSEEAMQIAHELGLDEYFAHHQKGLAARIQAGVGSGLSATVLDSVALVAELLGKPELILFDEANESLDSATDKKLLRLLHNRRGESAIIIASNRKRYHAICDRVFRLTDGRLVEMQSSPTIESDQAPGAARLNTGEQR